MKSRTMSKLAIEMLGPVTGPTTEKRAGETIIEITSAARAYEVFRPLRNLQVEEIWALALGPSLKLHSAQMIFRGTVSSCLIHPREIFRFGIQNNATSIIIAHNHPSQEATPSEEDIARTQQLILAGRIVEIPLIDHLLVTRNGFSSFREKKWCEFT